MVQSVPRFEPCGFGILFWGGFWQNNTTPRIPNNCRRTIIVGGGKQCWLNTTRDPHKPDPIIPNLISGSELVNRALEVFEWDSA